MILPQLASLWWTVSRAGGVLLCGVLPCLSGDNPGETTWARGVHWTLRSAPTAVPSALSVDRIYSEDVRHGFLRLGIVRRLVCKGVHFELGRSSDAAAGLKRLSEHLEGQDLRRHLVLRNVSIRAIGSGKSLVGCVEARPLADGAWLLSNVNFLKPGGIPQHLDRARMEAGFSGLRIRSGPESWLVEVPLQDDVQQ